MNKRTVHLFIEEGGLIMPGYAIHLAIGEKYAKKNNIQDKKGFIEGIIKPDLMEKEKSHYLDKNRVPKLEEFLKHVPIDTDYNKGYFLHLVTDYLFYTKFLQGFSEEIYHDYNKLNKYLIEKYNIHIPPEIQSIVEFEDGKPQILDKDSLCKFIDAISQIDFTTLEALKDYLEGCDLVNEKEETFK